MSSLREIAAAAREALFSDESGLGTWAVLDGASVQGLPRALHASGADSTCLLAGKLHPSMRRVAPYLVRLGPTDAFTDLLFERGWGRHWGIFLRTRATGDELTRHLRGLLQVRDPDGKVLRFRFYDPRVLRVYLPTCTPDELALVHGPVERFAMEDEAGTELLVFGIDGAGMPAMEVEGLT